MKEKNDKSSKEKSAGKITTSSRPTIPVRIQNVLWARAAGRCEFEGCNELLCEDQLTKKKVNGSQIAHIQPVNRSARYEEGQSEDIKTDINNLMLLCYKHHILVDKEEPDNYPKEVLLEMKRKHEERILRATAVQQNKQSLIVLYGANIAKDQPSLNYRDAQIAISPEYYIADNSPVRIQQVNAINERDEGYWSSEVMNMVREVKTKVLDQLNGHRYEHVSLFALAPQPLLVKLGSLLNEKYPIRVFQKLRVPNTWKWQSGKSFDYLISEPKDKNMQPVIVFAISGTDIINRTLTYYQGAASIWIMTVENPDMNILKSEVQLQAFQAKVRELLELVTTSTECKSIHVHMALPNSCAITLGRVWMPKVHKDLVLFESNKDGIHETIKIENVYE